MPLVEKLLARAHGISSKLAMCNQANLCEVLLQGERIDDLKMIVGRTADAATLFDSDGISVRFMNSGVQGENIRSSVEATNLIGQVGHMLCS